MGRMRQYCRACEGGRDNKEKAGRLANPADSQALDCELLELEKAWIQNCRISMTQDKGRKSRWGRPTESLLSML